MSNDTALKAAAKALCGAHVNDFCGDIGGDLGCKVGRGEAYNGKNCIATDDQLCMSGKLEAAQAAITAYLASAVPDDIEGLVARLHGPVQWGYMCLADGGFIADDTPLEAADTLTRLSLELVEARAKLAEIAELTARRQLPLTTQINDIAALHPLRKDEA